MKRQKKKLRETITENHLFDNWEYYNHEMELLQDKIDELEKRCSSIQGDKETILAENHHLRVRDKENLHVINQLQEKLDYHEEQEKIKKIPIREVVDYCKSCLSIEEAKPIIDMLYKWLRFIGTDEDYRLVDSIIEYLQKKEHATHIITKEVTIQEAQIQGALYEVKDNKEVNLGKEAV